MMFLLPGIGQTTPAPRSDGFEQASTPVSEPGSVLLAGSN
jgi:hypothetical protein